VEFSNLARRAGLPKLSLRLLAPICRPTIPLARASTVSEWVTYAAALTRVGAVTEALVIFDTVEANIETEKDRAELLLYRSFAYFAQWNYAASIPELKKYTRLPGVSPYQRLVGQTNLASAYIVEGHTEDAESVLNELLVVTKAHQHRLLYGVSEELAAQLATVRGDYGRARAYLECATQALAKTDGDALFFVQKWQAVLTALSSGEIDALLECMAVATQRRHWETVRQCDFYCALATGQERIYRRVHFGTPFPAYRKQMRLQMLAKFGDKNPICDLPHEFVFSPDSIKSPLLYMDLHSTGLKDGQMLQRALEILASDFYKPISIGQLFSELCVDEFFSLDSSPQRIFRTISRLREWLVQKKIPLKILACHGSFRIQVPPEYGLLVRLEKYKQPQVESDLQRLKQRWPYQSFTSTQASQLLGRQILATLKDAVSKKVAFQSGEHRATRYRFKK
jgi:tetratricopeptide (TPR) repeat protein